MNEERGKVIRFVFNMEWVKDGFLLVEEFKECELCNNVFDRIFEFVENMKEVVKDVEFEIFFVGLRFFDEVKEKEKVIWDEFGIEIVELINCEFNCEFGKVFGRVIGKDMLKSFDVVFIVEFYFGKIEF